MSREGTDESLMDVNCGMIKKGAEHAIIICGSLLMRFDQSTIIIQF